MASPPGACGTGADRRGARTLVARRAAAGLAALAVLALALAATSCQATSSGVGSPESPCFLALPAAKAAVHGRGHFSGVRYLDAAALAAALEKSPARQQAVPAVLTAAGRTPVCAVAYRGRYEETEVIDAWPQQTPLTPEPKVIVHDHIAVVVVRQKDSKVLVTMLFEREPIGFGRLFPALGRAPSINLDVG